MKKKIKILITGASGRIGYALYQKIKKKFDVIGLYNNNKLNKKFIKINLLDKKKITRIVNYFEPKIIFHFAAIGNHFKNKNNFLKNFKTTKNLVNVIKKKNILFVFLSTDKVYENNPQKNFEEFNVKPISHYAVSKHKCENIIVKSLNKYLILRIPIIDQKKFEKKTFNHFSLMIMEKFIKQLKSKQKVNIFNNIYRSFIFLEELILFFEKIITKNFNYGIYNAGSKVFTYYDRLRIILDSNINLKKLKDNVNGIQGNINPKCQSLNTKKFEKEFSFKFN